MKITIGTSFSTKGDMNIDSRHMITFVKNKSIHLIRVVFSILFLIGFLTNTFSQAYQIIVTPDSLVSKEYMQIPNNELFNETEAKEVLLDQIDSLRSLGYLASSIDSISIKKDSLMAYAFLGKRYEIQQVESGNLPTELYNKYFQNESLHWDQIQKNQKRAVQFLVDQGNIDSKITQRFSNISGNKIWVTLEVEEGPKYVLDSIKIVGDIDIKHSYVHALLHVQPGDVLNQNFFTKINDRLSSSRFMQLKKEPAFELHENGTATVFLDLEEKQANQFDLIIGFQPNPNIQLANRDLLITGQGQLQLYNPFGTGKEFSLDYKQQQPKSPQLDIDLLFPQFLNQDFGLYGAFSIFKLDTSFVKLNGQFGLDYILDGNKNVKLSYERSKSYLQRVDTNFVKTNKRLPNSIDYNQNEYFITFDWNKLNRITNTSKGFRLYTNFGAGNRTILTNSQITNLHSPDFDYNELYQGLNNKKLTLSFQVKGQYFLPLTGRNIFLLQNQTSYEKYNRYFENDLYRLGGINSIRGFDEQSILASEYMINTFEYRFLLNRESHFSVFTDWGLLKNKQKENPDLDNLIGVGSGLNLRTQAGIFAINLAVGNENGTGFDLNRTRFHIGYVNVF